MTLSQASQSELPLILAEMPDYGSEFAKTYANHAPMVLVALERIGGSSGQMRQFFEHYRSTKQLLPFGHQLSPLGETDWQDALGQREREPDLRRYFRFEVSRLGTSGALATYLPILSPGVGASALHALMRLAYALIRNDPDEVAIALAYWSATYLELPLSTGAVPITADPAEVLRRVADIPALHQLDLQELLWHNMRASGRVAEFAPVVDWLDISVETPARMASTSISLFAATMDFCALHAVTGMHWMRIVLPYTPQPEILLRHFWQCVSALMGEMRFPVMPSEQALQKWREFPAPAWSTIFEAARQSNDEHDLSLVFSASEEEKVYGDPLYRLAAARRMNLVADYAA